MLCRALCALMFILLTAERSGDALIYNGQWRSPLAVFAPLFDSLPGVRQPAWNLLFALVALACPFLPGAFRRRAWPMDAAIGLSLLTTAAAFVWGLARGGDGHMAYYQLNMLVIAPAFAFALACTMRKPSDLKAVGLTIVAAAALRSLAALYYFLKFVRGTEPYPATMTTHDDSPLFATGVLLVLVWAFVRGRLRGWLWAVALALPMLMAIKINNRRVAWFELTFALGYCYLLLPAGPVRRRVNRWMLVAAPVMALYVMVGWGRPGAVFTPLRAFDSTTGENQDSSSLARNEENLNLVITYLSHPLMGSGWGHKFTSVSSYYARFGGAGSFEDIYGYLPHNSIVGLVGFTGIVGTFGTLGILPVAAFLAARACRAARDPLTRAAAMAAFCVLPIYGVHGYADIGLQSPTGGMVLAAGLATAARVAAWTGAWPTRAATGRRSRRTTRPDPQPASFAA